MILKSLRVERFAGLNPGALVDAFGPDVTVIHGPNGIGKSTLFKALTYALYQRHGLLAQEAMSQIVPRGREVSPRVEVVFEADGATWRVAKQFYKKADAEIAKLERGVFVPQAQGSEAEDFLRDLLGSEKSLKGPAGAKLRGIGEILLVDQGDVRFDEKEGVSSLARDRLRLVIDQVGTTQSAHEILTAVEKRYAEVFGKTGLREKSHVFQLEEEIRRLEGERERLRGEIAQADDFARQLASLDAESPESAKEELERIEAELKVAQDRKVEAVRVRARREAVAAEIARLVEEGDRLRSASSDLKSLRVKVQRLAREVAAADVLSRELQEKQSQALEAQRSAQEDHDRILEHDRILVDRERAVRDARRAFELEQRLPGLEERVNSFLALSAQVAAAEKAATARKRPAQAEMKRVRAAFHALHDLERASQLLDFRVAITAEGSIAIECGAERIGLQANETRDLASSDGLELRIPGVARVAIRAPGGLERARVASDLEAARRAVDELSLEFGAADLEALETLARERSEIEAALQAANAARDAVFRDPAQADAARSDVGSSRATLAELSERHPEWRGKVPDVATVALEEAALAKDRQHASDLKAARLKLVESRANDARRAAEDVRKHDETLNRAKVDLAVAEAQIAQLQADGLSDEARDARIAKVEASRVEREREAATIAESLDVLADPDETIRRLATAKTEIEENRRSSEERRVRLTTQLDQLRAKGLWQAMADLDIDLERNREELSREQLSADALKLLRDVLVREQAAAVEAAVRPVADRVSRMARFLFGPGSKASFSEQIAPQTLAVDGADMPVGLLSAGTQDQLALLTRLALGELYAEKHGRHAFVLDDPLVNCDRERRGRLLEILSGSRSLQIVIFTCSPEQYRNGGLPADKTVFISMEDAKSRFTATASSLTA
jgi:DNA repair exonuclease SbcCD ATPase subunit